MAVSVSVANKNKADIRDGNEYKIPKWLVLKFQKRSRHFTDSKSCQVIESILKYKNGFKNNLMHKEIFN
jgi:hypothetical protein